MVLQAFNASANCADDDVVCAIRNLSESLNQNPWLDAVPTLIATLVGAFVGAFFAWLFSRNLAARERDAREAESKIARAERESERRADYADRMRREWPQLIPVLRELANAERARVDAAKTKTPLPGKLGLERMQSALIAATERLYTAASVAKGSDHTVVGLLGQIVASYTPYSVHGVGVLDEAYKLLVDYVTASPEGDATAKDRLVSALTGVLEDAREFMRQLK